MNKPVRVILRGDAKEAYEKLNKIVGEQIKENKENTKEIQLFNSINQKKEFVRLNPFYGSVIAKDKIPKKYIQLHDSTNLFHVELTNFWRMLYTVKGDQVEIICFILGIMDHDEYNKLFGYKKK